MNTYQTSQTVLWWFTFRYWIAIVIAVGFLVTLILTLSLTLTKIINKWKLVIFAFFRAILFFQFDKQSQSYITKSDVDSGLGVFSLRGLIYFPGFSAFIHEKELIQSNPCAYDYNCGRGRRFLSATIQKCFSLQHDQSWSFGAAGLFCCDTSTNGKYARMRLRYSGEFKCHKSVAHLSLPALSSDTLYNLTTQKDCSTIKYIDWQENKLIHNITLIQKPEKIDLSSVRI